CQRCRNIPALRAEGDHRTTKVVRIKDQALRVFWLGSKSTKTDGRLLARVPEQERGGFSSDNLQRLPIFAEGDRSGTHVSGNEDGVRLPIPGPCRHGRGVQLAGATQKQVLTGWRDGDRRGIKVIPMKEL